MLRSQRPNQPRYPRANNNTETTAEISLESRSRFSGTPKLPYSQSPEWAGGGASCIEAQIKSRLVSMKRRDVKTAYDRGHIGIGGNEKAYQRAAYESFLGDTLVMVPRRDCIRVRSYKKKKHRITVQVSLDISVKISLEISVQITATRRERANLIVQYRARKYIGKS